MDRPEAGTAPRLPPSCREAGLQQAPRACARHRRHPGQWTATGPRTAPGRTAAGPQGLAASGTTSPRIHPEWHAPAHGRHVGAHRVGTRSALRRTPRGHRLGSAYTHTVRSSMQAVPGKGTRRAHRDRYAGYEYPASSRRDVLGRPSKGPHAEQDSEGTHPAELPVLLGNAADDRGRALIHAGTILVVFVFLEHDEQESLAPTRRAWPVRTATARRPAENVKWTAPKQERRHDCHPAAGRQVYSRHPGPAHAIAGTQASGLQRARGPHPAGRRQDHRVWPQAGRQVRASTPNGMHPRTGVTSARIGSVRALPYAVLRGDTGSDRRTRTRCDPACKPYRERVREGPTGTVTPGTNTLPSAGGMSSADPQKGRTPNRIQKGRIQPSYPSSSGTRPTTAAVR